MTFLGLGLLFGSAQGGDERPILKDVYPSERRAAKAGFFTLSASSSIFEPLVIVFSKGLVQFVRQVRDYYVHTRLA